MNLFFKNVNKNTPIAAFLTQRSSHYLYYHNAPRYFIRAMTTPPYFWNEKDGEKLSVQVKAVNLNSESDIAVVTALYNSSLFYWWFILHSDCRHLNKREIESIPFDLKEIRNKSKFNDICALVMNSFNKNKYRKETYYKTTGKVVYDEYYPKKSKNEIDKIDTLLAEHYGFTEEELDFIINYDIKYRMGKELFGEADNDGEQEEEKA